MYLPYCIFQRWLRQYLQCFSYYVIQTPPLNGEDNFPPLEYWQAYYYAEVKLCNFQGCHKRCYSFYWIPSRCLFLEPSHHAMMNPKQPTQRSTWRGTKAPYPGVPNPWATDQYRSTACQEPGHTAGGEWRAIKVSSAAPHHSYYRLNHPRHPHPGPWKNCLTRNQSLVPKRLGTAALAHSQPRSSQSTVNNNLSAL